MLIEFKIKADLHIGHVIKISFNRDTGHINFTQSKKLLWEADYSPFYLLRYHLMMLNPPVHLISIKEFKDALFEHGIIYGCVLNYSNNVGYVHVTFHSNPAILHELSKVTLEARLGILKEIAEIRKSEKVDSNFYAYFKDSYTHCYCTNVLDPDLHKRCPQCTGYICTCGKCHCTEGKKFINN